MAMTLTALVLAVTDSKLLSYNFPTFSGREAEDTTRRRKATKRRRKKKQKREERQTTYLYNMANEMKRLCVECTVNTKHGGMYGLLLHTLVPADH